MVRYQRPTLHLACDAQMMQCPPRHLRREQGRIVLERQMRGHVAVNHLVNQE